MKKKLNNKKIFKIVLIALIVLYVVIIFINQERTLISYKKTMKEYKTEIASQLTYQESLQDTKDNISSEEYIEKIAREKLDMYLPNERVYVDKTK